MSEWKKCRISDLGRVITGKTPSTKNEEYWNGDVMFVTPKDIQSNKHIILTERYITQKGAEAIKGAVLPRGAICVSCIGNIGYLGITTERCVSNQQINSVIVSENNDTDFVYYLLKNLWPFFKNYEGQSTTLSILNKSQFSKIEVMVPTDRNEQRTIATVLNTLDNKIEENERINKNLEEQARLLYHSWFIDYEPFGGAVPSDWQNTPLGNIASLKTKSWSPAKNPDIIVEHYSIPAFDEKHYPVFEAASGIKSNKYTLTPESVMISKLNPDTKRIWRPMCLSEHPVCSTEFIIYEAKKDGQRDFIYSILDSLPFFNHLCSHTTGSTNSRQRAMPKTTLDFPVLLPPDEVITEFCGIVTPMYELISSNTIESQSLAKMRDSLLPRLMSGEIDVSDIDL